MNTEPSPPFKIRGQCVIDSLGNQVLTCSRDGDCDALYSAAYIDDNPRFMCPKCGRSGIRMEEATPEQCGLK